MTSQYIVSTIIIVRVQKLYRNGNSIAVTIPKDYLDQFRWKAGDKVQLELDRLNGDIIIKKFQGYGK